MTVTMALVDYVPVILFAISGIMIMRDMYNKMSKGAFALTSAGIIMIVVAGAFKATWKLLYAAAVCDFVPLNKAFFPMQATGFLLLGVGLIAAAFVNQGKGKAYCVMPVLALPALMVVAPGEYSGTMIFVALMVLGCLGMCMSLAVIAARMKKASAVALFVISFVLLMGMGYLSSRDVGTDAGKNWAAEGTNLLAQLTLLGGLTVLRKGGLRERKSL